LTLTAGALDNERVTDVHIAGVGMTRFGRRSESLPDLIAEAAQLALADARIERPDAIVIGAMNPEEFTGDGNFGSLINTHLGLSQSPALRVETTGADPEFNGPSLDGCRRWTCCAGQS